MSAGRHIGRRLLGAVAVAVLCASTSGARAQPAVHELSLSTPRDFAYLIGDRIEHVVVLELGPEHELDVGSLPEPGRITRWLALRDVVHRRTGSSRGNRHQIRLSYQVVNVADRVIGAGTPPHSLRVVGPDGDFPAVVPAWGFTAGPLVAPAQRAPGTLPRLEPARPPPPIPTELRWMRVLGLGLVVAGLLVALVHTRVGASILRRQRGPFARACRHLEQRMKHRAAPAEYARALVDVHTAFNETAGRAVFEHDLDRFFTDNPRYAALRASIEALFAESRRVFYAEGTPDAATAARLTHLRELCRACRELERAP